MGAYELLQIIGWTFAGLAAAGGIVFLLLAAFRQSKMTAQDLADRHERRARRRRR